jgi:hypothetical protein
MIKSARKQMTKGVDVWEILVAFGKGKLEWKTKNVYNCRVKHVSVCIL